MHITRVALLCLATGLLLAQTASAQVGYTTVSDDASIEQTGYTSVGDVMGTLVIGNDGGTYILLQKMVGDGAGFTTGYQRLGVRAKLADFGSSHVWGEGDVLITDDTQLGFNAGGGYRWVEDGNIIGIHGWFDNYETEYGNRYSQATFGVELLHEDVDVRANAYIPFGDRSNFVRTLDYGTVPVFDANRISFLGVNIEEQAMEGVDAEVGIPLFGLPWARAYAGSYYLASEDDADAFGVRGRVEAALSDDVTLNLMVTDDRVYNTNFNLGIEWRFSGGLPYPTFNPFHSDARKYAQVRRTWPVQTRLAEVNALVASTNPRTGQPWRVAHVNNTNNGPGNGTIDNPYRELPMSAQGADLILVDAGMGDTLGNIALEPYQRLLGEGTAHTFFDARRGLTLLPKSFSRVGPTPVLRADDPTRNVVTLSSFNEVNHLDFVAGTAAAIGGMDVTDFLIDEVRGVGSNGINIVNASGFGVIRDSSFNTTRTSVFVSNTSGAPLRLEIDDLATEGGLVGLHVAAAGADAVVDIDYFVGDEHADTGMILEATLDSRLGATVKDAFVLNSGNLTGSAFEVAASAGGEVVAHFDGILGRGTDDLFVVDVSEGKVNALVESAILRDSTGGSGVQMFLDDAVGRTTFRSLQASRNGDNGFAADVTGGSDYVVDIIDSVLLANVDDATETNIAGGSQFVFNIDPTMAIQSQNGSGLEFSVVDPGSLLIVNSEATNFSMSGLHGIDGHVFNGASAVVNLLRNAVDDNDGSGIDILVERDAALDLNIVDSSFDGSLGSGIDVDVRDGSVADIRLQNITATENGDYGLKVSTRTGVSGPSSASAIVTNSDFSGNEGANIAGASTGMGSVTTLDLDNAIADTMATMGGLNLKAEAGGQVRSDWNFGTISSTLGDGVVAHADGAGSRIDAAFDTLGINFNLDDGIDGRITNGGPGTALNISMINSSVTFNGMNGLDLDIAGGRSRVDLQGIPVTDNLGDGFEFDVSAGGTLVATASQLGPRGAFTNNGERGIDGRVTGAGSAALVGIEDMPINANFQEGVLLSTMAGGGLAFRMNDGAASDNAFDGVRATSTGAGSLTSVQLNGSTLSHNGRLGSGDGFEAMATSGGRVVSDLNFLTVTENISHGFNLLAQTGGRVDAAILAPNAVRNGQSGLNFDIASGGSLNGRFTNGNYTDSGRLIPSSGVFGRASGAGTRVDARFDGTISDSNPRHGFEFVADSGANFLARLDTTGASNVLSAQGNALSGAIMTVTGAGTSGNLLMGSPNLFNNNGQDGVTVIGTDTNQVVAQISAAQINGNGRDGVNINYDNVMMGAISITGDGPNASISNNVDDGIDISLTDTMLVSKVVDGRTVPAFLIDGFTIQDNGDRPIELDIDNVDADPATISNLTILGGPNGIDIALGNSNNWDLTIDNNQIDGVDNFGIRVTADGGNHNVAVTNNTVRGSGDTNIFVDVSGTATVGLNIDDNTIVGGGFGNALFNVGLNFTGTTRLGAPLPGLIPPDTMGAVGPNHIVELLNNGYTVYDKTTGVPLQSTTLDDFWLSAGIPSLATRTFDPRIVYDPTVGRWFAASIDGGTGGGSRAGNSIYVAVSNSSDPTGGWQAVQFVGDTIDGTRFNDFDTLGVDADGLYLATNNFGAATGFDVSVYSIPKSDLLLPTPTIANLTRFENLNSALFGDTIHGALDFGTSDGSAQLLATESFAGGTNLVRVDITGAGTAGATLGTPVDVPVAAYLPGPPARQPGGIPIENVSPRFNSSVVEVGDSLWGVHAVQGSSGNSALRWYEVDANTNTVLQSGMIDDPNVDFLDPSIAVNPSGVVMIGFTGSGPTQFASAMAAFGTTDSMGATSFQAPQVLQAGTSDYFLDFGSGRNRWGDYSATVVDPVDSDRFWTFQQYAAGPQNFGIQITEVNFTQVVIGDTQNDGVRLTVRDSSRLTPSTINGNTVTEHETGTGILVQLSDTASVDDLDVDGNTVRNNQRGVIVETASPNTLGGLSVSNNEITDNDGDGLLVNLNDLNPAVLPDIGINFNTVEDNDGVGIALNAVNSSLDDISVSFNDVANNAVGEGILVSLDNQTAGVVTTDSVSVNGNNVNGTQADGVRIELQDISGLSSVNIVGTQSQNSMGNNLAILANNSPIMALNVMDSAGLSNTMGDALLVQLVNSGVDVAMISRNQLGDATENGLNLDLDNSPIGDLQIMGNSVGIEMGMGGGSGLDDTLPVIRAGFNTSNLPANDDQSTGLVPLGFPIDFFGQMFTDTYVNNNGNITFTAPLGTFTPFDLLSTATPIIAPFFADVDTSSGNIVTYGQGTVATQSAFGVNWPGVRHFSSFGGGGLPENIFQLVLVDRSDVGVGDFDVEFNYQQILWESGEASGGNSMGLGGSSARAGLANGTNFALELPGSAVNGAFLDGGPGATSLIQNSLSSMHDGRYVFFFRNGSLGNPAPSGGDGILINARNGSDIGALNVSNNMIDGNGTHGLEILADNSTLPSGAPGNTARVEGNTIINHTNGDAIRLVNPDTNGTPIAMDFVDNTLTDNGLLGLNLQFDDNSGGLTSTITGNAVTGSGSHGASISGTQNVTLNLTIGDDAAGQNMFNANGDTGLVIDVTDNVQLPNTVIANSTFNENTTDGLRIMRRGSAVVDNVEIRTSTMSNNMEDGVDILAQSADQTDEYTLTDNTISSNSGRGLAMRVEADADIVANLMGNDISMNGSDGVEFTQLAGMGDTPSFSGNWSMNTISGNTGHGVQIEAVHDFVLGSNANPVPDTVISGNTLTGILVNHPGGNLELNNVQIDSNGQQGILFNSNGNTLSIDPSSVSNNGGNGLEINATGAGATVAIDETNFNGNGGSGVVVNANGGPTVVTIDQSTFNTNMADGLQVNANSGTTTVTGTESMFNGNQSDGVQVVNNATGTTVSLTSNIEMRNNVRRGANILNRANGTATVTIDDAMIRQNGREGVYVVNTASATQSADADATTALLANGSVLATPTLDFTLSDSRVLDNGLASGFDGTGLVMRVGTSGGSTSFTDNGGFVSDGLGNLTGRSGVLSHVMNNVFGGNFGEDVVFESFVSTVTPTTTAGTWDAMTFSVTTYQTDSLARLDLYFEGNMGDSTDVTRAGAFYNNSEPIFKSRLATQVPGGPFDSATRDRNAQRQAFRGGAFAAPLVSPDMGMFLYPGVGASTFRTSAASSTAGFTDPGSDTFGDMVPLGGSGTGELDFLWGTF